MTNTTTLPKYSISHPRIWRTRRDWKEPKALLSLALPITGAALVNMGMSITDTVMMGWIGPTALAAGAVISDLYSIVFYFVAGILSITAPMVSRAIGAGDLDEAGRTMRSGFFAASLLAAPSFAAVWFAPSVLSLIGVNAKLLALADGYAHAMAFAVVAMVFVCVWRNIFAAIGRPQIFLGAILAALPVNAIANLVLMFGWGPIPGLGVAGAGIASALVAFGLLIGFVTFGMISTRLSAFRQTRSLSFIELTNLQEIFRIGTPVAFFSMGEVGIFLIATIIVSLFGADSLAAHAITLRIAGVIYTIPTGLSQATTIRVGHAIGRSRMDSIHTAMTIGVSAGIASGVAIFSVLGVIALFVPILLHDANDSGLIELVSILIFGLGLLNLAQGFAAPATAILRGFKDTRIPMFLCLGGYWLVGMPVSVVAGFHLEYGVLGIWIGLIAGVIATAFLMNLRLRHLRPWLVAGARINAGAHRIL